MRFIIERERLLQTLLNVSRGLSQKTPMPVLTGIQIIVEKEQIRFITTNKEITVQVTLEKSENVKLLNTGSCVVPGKYFIDIVKKVEGKNVEFNQYDDSNIQILSDRSEFTLIAHDKNNFPKTSFDTTSEPILFDSKSLKQIIRQTSFACGINETRIVLTSLNFSCKDGVFNITATDSFRLAQKTSSLSKDNNFVLNIPSKSLEEFNKILDEESSFVKMYLENNKVLFVYKNIIFVTRLVEGNYPNTSSLFPKEFLFEAKFNRSELISAVDRASLFGSIDNLNVVKFVFSNQSNVEISSNSSEVGKVVEEVKLKSISENVNFQIAYSIKYLIEALRAFDTDEITFCFTGEIKPTIIKNEQDQSLIQLLLPVRVF